MQHRYSIHNRTHLIEFPYSAEGFEQAVAFRKENPTFKGQRIVSIIQACPDEVPLGVIVERDFTGRDYCKESQNV